ncbi:hypothetical protein BY458DRAFT_520803, partial [Sporodiniella umbellata]
MSFGNDTNWDNFDRLLLEASRLSLDDCKSDAESITSYGSLNSYGPSSLPSLSRNSTMSSSTTQSTSPRSRHSALLFSSNYPSNTNQYLRDNIPHKPHAISECSLPTQPQFNKIIKKNFTLGPEGCFANCTDTHSYEQEPVQPFVVPVFGMAGRRFADILSTLFNFDEKDPHTIKQDCENTVSLVVDGVESNMLLSQYTYKPKSYPAWKHLAENLGQRQGINSLLVATSYHALDELYLLLNNLIHSMDQTPSLSCSWWSRVVLVIDDCQSRERRLFLAEEMPKIMSRYKLNRPISVLFIHSSEKDIVYKADAQRILKKIMDKHVFCGRWIATLQDADSDSSSDDDIFTLTTVIEYSNGKRKRTPKTEKLNSYPGD